jgi:predicted DNA-binding transcriptional regulator YafY
LHSGSTLNASELAEALEVSRRTVFRDIQFLRDAGVEIIFDDRQNTYSVPRGNPVPGKNLTRDEIAMILLATKSSPIQANPALAMAADGALAKLLAGRGDQETGELTRLASKCAVDTGSGGGADLDSSVILIVLRAMMMKRQIRITLKPSGAETATEAPPMRRTKVAPYHLVFAGETWQIVGRSSMHRRNNSFDLREIASAELIDETYEPPPAPHRRIKPRRERRPGVRDRFDA